MQVQVFPKLQDKEITITEKGEQIFDPKEEVAIVGYNKIIIDNQTKSGEAIETDNPTIIEDSSNEIGTIFHYIGNTTGAYTKNYYYIITNN